MSYTRAYFPLLEVRHRVDPITINIPISTRFRVHIGTVSLHGKVQMSSRGIARIPVLSRVMRKFVCRLWLNEVSQQ